MKYTVAQVYAQCNALGWTPAESRKMAAITLRETGGTLDGDTRNYNPPIEDSWGVFQINMLAHAGQTTVECARSMPCAAKFARALFIQSGFQPWAGTQDEAGLAPFYARVDAELSGKGIDPNVGIGPITGVGGVTSWQDDLKRGIKDALIITVILTIGIILFGLGAYGLVTGSSDIKGSIRSIGKNVVSAAKIAAVV